MRAKLHPVGLIAQRLIDDYLRAAQHRDDLDGALFRPVKNNVTKTLTKHLHPDSVYQGIVKRYGAQVGITIDVHGFCVHALRATAATNALAHNVDIANVPTSRRRACTTAGRAGRRRATPSRWSIE